jgi:hypothetical protein
VTATPAAVDRPFSQTDQSSDPARCRREPGMAVANVHVVTGRYAGWPLDPMSRSMRIEDGKVDEHWEVMQAEVLAGNTKSGSATLGRPLGFPDCGSALRSNARAGAVLPHPIGYVLHRELLAVRREDRIRGRTFFFFESMRSAGVQPGSKSHRSPHCRIATRVAKRSAPIGVKK